MFIQTETTPNPLTLKFIPGVDVNTGEPVGFTDKRAALISPLAEALFAIPEVKGVFLGSDFITVTRSENKPWELLKAEILTTIMEHFVAGRPVLLEEAPVKAAQPAGEDSDLVKQIKEIIETRVRPAVAQDGGDIIFHSFEDGVVKLELHGSCSGCPSSTVTLKSGIENMLKHYIPEIIAVEAVA
jgi:NFU1 iron-sulfur cluster scaffold homolog, mitochondrial